ncbi:MAG: HAD family hydrolase [Prolixibacteraceae bacterium]
MQFEGVLFDLDGTLVNSLDDIADSMNTVLQQRHFPPHPNEDYKLFIGNGLRNLVRTVLPEASAANEELVGQCLASMVKLYNANCLIKTKPYAGITELLDQLTSRGIRLAILSNKNDALTKKIVQALLPERNFEYVAGLTTEALKKPNPAEALRIAREMGIPSEKILYVGDSGTDMQTATNAGMFAVGVLWGFRSKEELLSNGAKALAEYPEDLVRMLH